MPKGFRIYHANGRAYKDPGGYTLEPRSWWDEDELLDIKPWHPALFWKYLLYLAVWDIDGKTVRRGGEIVHVERGQLYYSLRYLGVRPGWSKAKVARELALLEKDGRIIRDPLHGGTVITIINYDPYQDIAFYGGVSEEGRKTVRDVRRKAGQGQLPTRPEDTPETRPPVRRDSVRDVIRRRDADETNNKAVQSSECKSARKRETPTATPTAPASGAPPVTWTAIAKLREIGILDLCPVPERTRQLLEAVASGPPPTDLHGWARRNCEELGIDFPYDRSEDDPDNPAGDELEQQLREKLKTLTARRR